MQQNTATATIQAVAVALTAARISQKHQEYQERLCDLVDRYG